MENTQNGMVSGSVFAAPYKATDTNMLGSRIPRVGTKVSFWDGREFVFCSTKADLTAGNMVGMRLINSGAEIVNVVHVAAIGATEVIVDISGLTLISGGSAGVVAADDLAGMMLSFTDDTGEGYQYKIKSNTATSSAHTTLTLCDALIVAVSTDTDCVISSNPYECVVQGSATCVPIGAVVRTTTAATDSVTQYVWVQTKGVATVTGAATLGLEVATAASGLVANAAEAGSGAYDCIVGTGVATTANGQAVVFLRL
jgi:hypothetical protein